jgi:4-amino-4-deoxy-L-arabinose transferase-like glycosyltransferase
MLSRLRSFALSSAACRPGVSAALALFLFLFGFVALLFPHRPDDLRRALPEAGDGPDYDSLAFSLLTHHSFAFDFGSPAFRAPYEAANVAGEFDYLLLRRDRWVTTYKAPGFPLVLATTYYVFGRQWLAIRLLNTAAMAAGMALMALIVRRIVGNGPAILAMALFVAVDPLPRSWCILIMTESLAALMVAALAWFLVRASYDCKPLSVAIVGVVAGLAILVRSIFVLWLPGLAIMIALLVGHRKRWRATILFVLVALAVPLPWFVRNSVVLRSFDPLGTQGAINLAAGYNDDAWRRRGEWSAEWSDRLHGGVCANEPWTLECERKSADRGRAAFVSWVREHPTEVPGLAVVKTIYSWLPREPKGFLLLLFAAVGFLSRHRRVEVQILVGLLLLNTGAIAATYWVEQQFQIPTRSVVAAGAALGLAHLGEAVRGAHRGGVPDE